MTRERPMNFRQHYEGAMRARRTSGKDMGSVPEAGEREDGKIMGFVTGRNKRGW
jgi:hypothetical protein